MKVFRSTGHPGGKGPSDKTEHDGSGTKRAKYASSADGVSVAGDQAEDKTSRHDMQDLGDSTGTAHNGIAHAYHEAELLNKDYSALEQRKGADAAPDQENKVPGQEKVTPDHQGNTTGNTAPGNTAQINTTQINTTQINTTKGNAGIPPGHGGIPPGQQQKEYQERHSVHPEQASPSSSSHTSFAVTSTVIGSRSSGVSGADSTSCSSSSWVRIPYPLSAFLPVAEGPSAQPATPIEPSSDSDETSVSPGNGTDTKEKREHIQVEARYLSIGFGMTELRESNVDVLNEAGDAIWKNNKSTTGTRSDTDDL